ncbi:MAG TPA: tyrosine-type recombinase/integrase [Candidatus Nitrosopolaris sp.]
MSLRTWEEIAASIKSPKTSEIYRYGLSKYMAYRKVSDIGELLATDSNPRLIQASIIEYLVNLKQKGLSYSYRNVQLSSIKHFYRMNDIELNWFRIAKYLGEHTKVARDRAYTNEEIQRLLLKADERMRVVILLLASTGLRIGAIPGLQVAHLSKIEDYGLYQITVYQGSTEEYYCFCTPECAAAIDSYLAYRERYGEKLISASPLIREQFDISEPDKIRNPRPISQATIGTFLQDLLARSGLITISRRTEDSQRGRKEDRKDVMRAHGFRKKVTTDMIRSKVDAQAREMLLGHSIGLCNSYYRPDSQEMLEEYLKAVDLLTINEENRLRIENKYLKVQMSQMQELQNQIDLVKRQLQID